MKKTLFTLSLFGFLLSASAQTDSVVFNFTGAAETFTVPACINSTITVKLFGAQGANGGGVGAGIGGNGSFIQGNVSVIAGQQFIVTVAGAGLGTVGGFGGGGGGGNVGAEGKGGGGGGASSITSVAGLLAIASGGGGGGGIGCAFIGGTTAGGNGGDGGENGSNGIGSPTSSGGVAGAGFGAIGSAGGLKGIGCSGFLGNDGTSGTSFQGGNGGAAQTCCCPTFHTDPSGGGGGGGFLGGGGGGAGSAGTVGCTGNEKGAGGGGAGGSNFISSSLTDVVVQNGVQSSNGRVVVLFTPVTLVMPTSIPGSVCDNLVAFTLPQGTPSGGTWSGNGVVSNVFNPATASVGRNTLTYTFSGNGCNLSDTTSINVFSCSKIDEVEAAKFALFPNPVSNEFTILAKEGSKIETVQVMDASGKTIFSSKPNSQSFQVETSTWAAGVYSVRINDVVKTVIKN